jgi:outer membrane protein assembly factor BamB
MAAVFALIFSAPDVRSAEDESQRHWPQWRGPLLGGVAPLADPPLEWSAEKNVRWKTALPGNGHSTPVVWGERIFLTAAIPFGEQLEELHTKAPGAHDNVPVTQRHRFIVLAVNRRDGKILWQKTVHEALPHDGGGHYSASLASNSPATDGERVYAFFGSHGLYCLTLEGELVWKKDLGKMYPKHGHGEGASPALFGDVLVVNWDHDRKSFVIALNKHTGEELWKVDRDEETSWSSPIIVEHAGKLQTIISGTNRIRGYDLATGKVL